VNDKKTQAHALEMGDTVRIRRSHETATLGLAGLTGTVYGFTTPSVTKPEVIGEAPGDLAFNVHLSERDEELWFNPDCLEFVDHGGGMTASISGKDFVRTAGGEWRAVKRPWWKFWGR
jgi:hypothetical protein